MTIRTFTALKSGAFTLSDMVGWRRHLMALGLVSAAILLLFAGDASDMVAIWWNASSYQHCLFVPLIIGWLVQQRVDGLRHLKPSAWWPGLIWCAGGSAAWLLGDAASVALFRHVGLVVMLQGAVIATLGLNVTRGLIFPLFYMFFMVPVGEELVPFLQGITADISMVLLGWVGIPAHIEGIFITTPTGYFEVAEACSGAKFLIAMTAYSVLVANVCFKSWSRRIAFVTAALLISILGNGIRAFGIMYVAHLTSTDIAVGVDHVVYGWAFFAVIMVVVMAAGWRFFDRGPADPWFDATALQGRTASGAALGVIAPLILIIALASPAWSSLSARSGYAVPAQVALPTVSGWNRTEDAPALPWSPHFAGADHVVQGRYRNADGAMVDLAIVVYARQLEGKELVGFGQGATVPDGPWTWSATAPAPQNGLGEQLTGPGPVLRHVVTYYSIGGVVTGQPTQVKLETLKARLTGGDQRAVAILVSAEVSQAHRADATIAAFVRDLGSIKDLADRSAGIR